MKDSIYDNVFSKNVIDRGSKIIKLDPVTKADARRFFDGKERKRKKRPPYIRYVGDVHYRFVRIVETLDDIQAAQVFLRQYPYPKTLKKNNISRAAYTAYHMEVYFTKVASLRDKLALLTSTVFDLGLSEKDVSLVLLSRMTQLKGKRVISLLKKFSNALDGISYQRNIIAHSAKYDDEGLKKIQMYELFATHNKTVPVFLIRYMTRVYVKEKLDTFKKNQKQIDAFLDVYLLEINKEFNRQCKMLPKPF